MSDPARPACAAILVGISAYLDGDLDSTACETIERHCADCPECRRLVQGLRDTVGLCRQAASAPLPEPIRRRAQDSIRRLLAQTPKGD